jgi:hypothetical protein
MAVIVQTKTKKKEVGFLENVDVDFVSLVRHGANQKSFKVIKNENGEGGESSMQIKKQVIQSIFTPAGIELDKMAETPGLEYLVEASSEGLVKSEHYNKYDQIPASEVEEFKLLKAEPGWIVVGTLKEGSPVEKAITLSSEQIEKIESLPISPAMSPLSESDSVNYYGPMFMDYIHREMNAMSDIVTGVLIQVSTTSATRRKTIFSAIDSFKSFMSMALDALGNQEISVAKIEEITNALQKGDTQGGEQMELFKSMDEFNTAVGAIVAQAIKDATPVVEPVIEKAEVVEPVAVAAVPDTAVLDAIAAIAKSVETIGTEVKTMKEKADAQFVTEPAANAPESDVITIPKQKESPFSGLLLRAV